MHRRAALLLVMGVVAVAVIAAASFTGAASTAFGASRASTVVFRTYAIPVKSSRGYTFVVHVKIRKPATFKSTPGYNVGESDLAINSSNATLWITNNTPGRQLDVMSGGTQLAIRALWRLPRVVDPDGVEPHHFIRGLFQYGVSSGVLTIPPRGTMGFPLDPIFGRSAGGFAVNSSGDSRVVARALATYPSLIEIISSNASVLDGNWTGCYAVNDITIAAITGTGRRLALNERNCSLFHQK